jgi:hypothetical protein
LHSVVFGGLIAAIAARAVDAGQKSRGPAAPVTT